MRQGRGSSQVFADPEAYWRGQGLGLICGVDEAGRGPLAGPVVAAAVIMPAAPPLPGLKDSKLVTPENRATLDGEIRQRALAFAVMEVGAREIERLGHPRRQPQGHGPGSEGPHGPAGNGAGGRQPAPASGLSPAAGGQRRPPLPCHIRRLHSGQGPPGPAHGGLPPRLPPIQFRQPQGLRHRRAPGGPGVLGAVPPPPAHLQRGAGVASAAP